MLSQESSVRKEKAFDEMITFVTGHISGHSETVLLGKMNFDTHEFQRVVTEERGRMLQELMAIENRREELGVSPGDDETEKVRTVIRIAEWLYDMYLHRDRKRGTGTGVLKSSANPELIREVFQELPQGTREMIWKGKGDAENDGNLVFHAQTRGELVQSMQSISLSDDLQRKILLLWRETRDSYTTHLWGVLHNLVEYGYIGLTSTISATKHDHLEDLNKGLVSRREIQVSTDAGELSEEMIRHFFRSYDKDDGFMRFHVKSWKDIAEDEYYTSLPEAARKAVREFWSKSHCEEKDLFSVLLYMDLLEEIGGWHDRMKDLMAQVLHNVRGLTKEDEGDAEGKKEKTFGRLLEASRDRLKAIIIKLMDRLHNLETLDGLSPEKQKKIGQETLDVYIPLARVLRMKDVHERLARLAVRWINPQLLEHFDMTMEGKMGDFCGKDDANWKMIIGRFNRGHVVEIGPGRVENCFQEGIESISITPYRFVTFLENAASNKPVAELTIDDLPISRFDPQFMIDISVRGKNDVEQVKYFIEHEFCDGHEYTVKVLPYGAGILLSTTNKKYGGELVFHINDVLSRERLKRGDFFSRIIDSPERGGESSDGTPPSLRREISEILKTVDPSMRGIFEAAEGLFRNQIQVLTKDNDIVSIPREGTGLDFTKAIHDNLLARAQSMMVKRGMEEMELPLLAPLQQGDKIHIETLSPGEDDPISPEWVSFMSSRSGKSILRSRLRNPSSEKGDEKTNSARLIALGKRYVKRVARLVLMPEKEIIRILDEGRVSIRYRKKGTHDEKMEIIGSGEIDVLAIVAEYLEKDPLRQIWNVDVVLPNRRGEFSKLSGILAQSGLNINPPFSVDRYSMDDSSKARVLFRVQRAHEDTHEEEAGIDIDLPSSQKGDNQLTLYDLLKILIQLQELGYEEVQLRDKGEIIKMGSDAIRRAFSLIAPLQYYANKEEFFEMLKERNNFSENRDLYRAIENGNVNLPLMLSEDPRITLISPIHIEISLPPEKDIQRSFEKRLIKAGFHWEVIGQRLETDDPRGRSIHTFILSDPTGEMTRYDIMRELYDIRREHYRISLIRVKSTNEDLQQMPPSP